jgi:SAM-dependent methyltransferase
VFDALREPPLTVSEVAERCGTDADATGKLLFALAASGYARASDGDRYELTPLARRWLTSDAERSLTDKLLFQYDEWDFLGGSEEYVRSGESLEVHSVQEPELWGRYQRGMRSLARAFAEEGVRRTPVPKGAERMLDIGGSHGYYSVALCRRHDRLRSEILDLPAAVEHAAPLLAEEGMGDRVVHRPGNALIDDLGEDAYDLVVIVQLVHHFRAEENRELARRVAHALRPGGVYAIFDAFRTDSPKRAGQIPALLEFYFALTSRSGTWSREEMAGWQRDAGLKPKRAIRLRTGPGGGIQAAVKPG